MTSMFTAKQTNAPVASLAELVLAVVVRLTMILLSTDRMLAQGRCSVLLARMSRGTHGLVLGPPGH
jgi:hypothetical protein